MKCSIWSRDVEVFCTRRGHVCFVAPLRRLVSNCKQNSLKPRSHLLRQRHSSSTERTTEETQTNWNGGGSDCCRLLGLLFENHLHSSQRCRPEYGETPLQLPSSLCFSHRSSAASASTTRVARAAIAVAPVTTSRPGWREPSTPGTSVRVSGAHAK